MVALRPTSKHVAHTPLVQSFPLPNPALAMRLKLEWLKSTIAFKAHSAICRIALKMVYGSNRSMA